jgi:endo-1,4-beta-xylanase
LTITATNGVAGPAYATQITGLSLKQDSGPPCTPTITAPGAFPIALGDIAPGASASSTFTISLVGCNPNAEFVLMAPWSSATYHTGTFVLETNFSRGN